MARTTQNSGKVQRRTAIGFIALMGLLAPVLPASASPPEDSVIVLKGATSAEGIAAGSGTTFYAGDLALGDIYRGDIRKDKARLFIDVSDFDSQPRAAVGMKADTRNNLLFVAGGGTGKAFVYDTESGEPVEDFTLAPGFINDVALTRDGAWFTNSAAGELYFLPVGRHGELGDVETLRLSGPAAGLTGPFNLNGIAAANGDRVLIVAHSNNKSLYTVDPDTGVSARIDGVDVPNVDGILVRGHTVWAVQNFLNQIVRIDLSNDLSSGEIEDTITSPAFDVPTTVARFGNTLAAVNAQFERPASPHEVVLVPARD
ncbi:sugar lactone lactonase YvrE [Arthrobacter sp. UYNi723]